VLKFNAEEFFMEVQTLLIIGIAGGTGAGKTTVARAIAGRLGTDDVTYMQQDWYYLDRSQLTLEERDKLNLDHPDSFDSQLLLSHLNQLRQGLTIEAPTYDYLAHTRGPKTISMPARPVVILEGILVLAIPDILSVLDIKVFVDADPDIRLIRRLERDIRERGNTMESAIKRYLTTVKPMHEAFVEPSKRHADIIVPRGGQNEIAIDLLSSLVENYLEDRIA
jgi:uridine kinase